MSTGSASKRTYPWTTRINGTEVTLRLMQRSDLEKAIRFARELPHEDLMFLTVDITDPAAMEQYYHAVEKGQAVAVLAESGGRFVGYGSLEISQPRWTHHLGEIRLLVSRELRGKGLGRVLASEVFQLAQEKGLRKIIARMAVEQKGARQVFEKLGFHAEALLTDFVMDREGVTHDLIVMTHDVTGLTE
ncbi:MAG TPA: GNAT family N-acetyltransferase [Blastocatellia bacterium]|nr:GNAT family N-acetyltransferase [Blastocatellia bacterium]